MKKHLPNFLTCCNLLCGCIGIISILEEWEIPVAYFVWAAGIFDFLDGFAARMLRVTSPIGKELDSLADVVSFGVLPALVMYKLIGGATPSTILPYVALLIAMFSALRLAIFNIDTTQTDSFKGLNTPANTLFISSLPLISGDVGPWLYEVPVLLVITIILSLLLVSRIEFFAFKFRNFSWGDNQIRYIFLIVAFALLVGLQFVAIPLVILLYIVLSLFNNARTIRAKS